MKTELKIIRQFIEDNSPKTIRELSKQIKADYRITHTAVHRLINQNILNSRPVGKSSLCKFNDSYNGIKIYRAENERKEEILQNSNINQLYKEIMPKLHTSFFVMLIFGSYAKGKQTKTSDIDLLFISNIKDFENNLSNILSILPLKTHALTFTEEEFIRMKDAKKPNVVHEAMKNNIILYGMETYYRIKNA